MPYLMILLLSVSFPAYAEFGFDSGIRKPQSIMVAGNSVIDDDVDIYEGDEEFEEEYIDDEETSSIDPIIDDMVKPVEPIHPTSPSAPVATRKVLKKIPKVKAQRSIADDRIDDSYVQDLIKNSFEVK